MGKDAQPLQSVKNCYNSRAHGHELWQNLLNYMAPHAPVIVLKTSDGYACVPYNLKSLSGVLGKPESSTIYNSHRINKGVTTIL
jgi:hypothetical protein